MSKEDTFRNIVKDNANAYRDNELALDKLEEERAHEIKHPVTAIKAVDFNGIFIKPNEGSNSSLQES